MTDLKLDSSVLRLDSSILRLDSSLCQSFDTATDREWLETNGTGGYAAASIAGANTRRYHGLLVAAAVPPLDRFVMLSKLDESISFAGAQYDLSTNIFSGAVHPRGYSLLQSFSRGVFPVWEYSAPGISIRKTVAMISCRSTVVVLYEVTHAAAPFTLTLRPLIAARQSHDLTHRNDAINGNAGVIGDTLTLRPYEGVPQLKIWVPGAAFTGRPDWYYNFEYPVERARGFASNEDLFTPGWFEVSLRAGSVLAVVATTERVMLTDGQQLIAQERRRREQLVEQLPAKDDLITALALAADQFLVKRGDGLSIIAGYPWFSDWGRDTMISLPGLTLATRRFDDAQKILKTFLHSVSEGMIPNLFPEGGEAPLYNTVDATLWMFIAIYAYSRAANDRAFVEREALPVLRGILDRQSRGTRYQIREDGDGLLHAGDPSVQLTWMDAKIGSWVVTPRSGKPVEVQALWYNAHCIVAQLLSSSGDSDGAKTYRAKAQKILASFKAQFWNEDKGYFFDYIDGAKRDDALRPNQLFALSLPFPLATPEQAAAVLKIAEEKLYTPVGLRTLSPDQPSYHGRYNGGPTERDGAYHQGTAWAWLLGPYLSAVMRYQAEAGYAKARAILDGIRPHLLEGCVGSISEIFDGDSPNTPRGAFAQAWSVAEILRAAVELQSAGRGVSAPDSQPSLSRAARRVPGPARSGC